MTELAIKATPTPEDKLLSLREVAQVFGRDNQWVVRNIIQRGDVDCVKVNHSWFIYERSFKAFLNSSTKKAR